MSISHLYLTVAIIAETIATTEMKSSESFTKFWPSLVTICGYAISFYFLSLTLRTIPVGIVYALWSGIGIVLISILGWLVHKQTLDAPAVIGLGLILIGVLVINAFSKSIAH